MLTEYRFDRSGFCVQCNVTKHKVVITIIIRVTVVYDVWNVKEARYDIGVSYNSYSVRAKNKFLN